MKLFRCRHKFGKVENGYQYCLKCGRMIVAPCSHKWEDIERVNVSMWKNITGYIIVQCCSLCTEIRQVHIGETRGHWPF
jgi:hypothetical protein